MKYFLITAIVVMLTACNGAETTGEEVNGFDIVCMNGVQYYFDSAGAYGRSLAPVIDTETLTFVQCEEIN